MFSKEGSKLLADATAECSYGSISIVGPSTGKVGKSETQYPELSSSAPAILEPSKHTSFPTKPHNLGTLEDDSSLINTWRTLATSSCPEFSFRVPVTSDDQTNDLVDGQITDEQEMDVPPTICSTLINFYKNTAITLRNSFFIHVFQVLFALLQVSAIVMGVLFDGKCVQYERLPVYGGVTAFPGLLFTGFWMSSSYCYRFGRSDAISHLLLCLYQLLVFLCFVTLDMIKFGIMASNYDEETTNCSKTFYKYAFYKHIATGASAVLGTLLYLPGSCNSLNLIRVTYRDC